jgi:hypothetical protein
MPILRFLRLLLLISFAPVAASLRRGALVVPTPGTATAAFAVLRCGRQRRGYNIEEPKW